MNAKKKTIIKKCKHSEDLVGKLIRWESFKKLIFHPTNKCLSVL